jgi:paraquat-inducible protein B
MRRHANATRIGLFALGGAALIVLAVVTVLGGKLFANNERAVMYFGGSIWGLQVGAPVVFRGVRIGSVVSIGLVHDAASDAFVIPVQADLDRGLIHDLEGNKVATDPTLSLQALVDRGLRAQLAMQSLLTGQLYIDLDLRPRGRLASIAAAAEAVAASSPSASVAVPAASPRSRGPDGPIEIPTSANRLQTLQAQLEGLDLGQLSRDIAATAASARQLLGSPALRQTLDEVALASAALRRVVAAVEPRVAPLSDSALGTLAEGRAAVGRIGAAADKLGTTAERVSAVAGRVDSTLAPGSPLLGSVQGALDELGRSAAALRQASADDSATMAGIERALQDVSRASRAVRELAELLERQPDALIRGRKDGP